MPQTGGRAGIVLAEAMAADAPLWRRILQAFKDVSCNDACRAPQQRSRKTAEAVCTVLKDDARRSSMVRAGMARSDDFDWATVTDDSSYGLAGTGQAAGTSACASVFRAKA